MIKPLIYTFFSRSAVAVANFAILLLTSRWLGSGVLGQASLLIVNVALTQTINEIYTGYALVHFIPGRALQKIYAHGLLWSIVCCSTVSLIIYGLHPGTALLHTLLLSLAISLHSFHCVIALARERFRAYNLLVFLQPLVMLLSLLVLVVVLQRRGFESYLAGLYLSYGASAMASGLVVLRLLKSNEQKQPLAFFAVVQKGVVNQLGNLAHTLSNRLNYYLIGTTALVGVYAGGTSLIESVWIIGNSISPVLLSRVANRRGTASETARLTFGLAQLSFLLSALCVAVVALLPPSFFTWLLGADFNGVKPVLLKLSPGILCISFSTVISHYFSGKGQQRVQLLANLAGLLVTACAAPLLIPRLGLAGACYAASLAYLVQALVNTGVFVRRTRLGWKDLLTWQWRELYEKLR